MAIDLSAYATYLENIRSASKQAAANTLASTEASIAAQKQTAADTLKASNRTGYTSYQQSINPYGITAESLAGAGLGDSGIAESAKIKAYQSYRNTLSSNAARQASTLAGLDTQLLSAQQTKASADLSADTTYNNAYLEYKSLVDSINAASSSSRTGYASAGGDAPNIGNSSGGNTSSSNQVITNITAPTDALKQVTQSRNTFSSEAQKAQDNIAKIQKNWLLGSRGKQTAINTIFKRGNLTSYEIATIKKNLGL